ncbi:hypothetical protein Tco_0916844, partial [Tanacetum coccineum]
LGLHLEEIHVTWAHLEKKQTRLQTCTKIHQEILFSERGDGVAGIKRRRHDLSGDDVWILATASQHSRIKVDLKPSTWRRSDLDNSTSNVLIPLDSWTSGLLVYKLPLSVMAEPIFDDIENAPTEPNLSITSNDIEIELNEKFLVELRKNMYQGTYNEDVVFPLSLADDAKEWWISEGDGKITTWEELVEKFFCRFYPESYDGEDEIISSNNERKESKYKNPSNTTTDSFFKAYDVCDIEKENGRRQTKRKDDNNDDKRPDKRRCKAEKFEAIQYSIGPNEEYIAIRSYEYDIWERNKDNLSIIYQDIFQKKDEGWKVTRTKE